jgi:tRNA (guanine-N7-)-methyltransferase
MPKKKLIRMTKLSTLPNTFEKPPQMAGMWNSKVFKNRNPIVLELACGKGEYTVELARLYPEKNFIGVDKKGARLWSGAIRAVELTLKNTAFLRIRIENLNEYFDVSEIEEIWIPFPDPHPKKGKSNKRITSRSFLDTYRRVLRPEGRIHLKTDDEELFRYTLQMLELENASVHRLIENLDYHSAEYGTIALMTAYEKRHLKAGRTTKYVCFSL